MLQTDNLTSTSTLPKNVSKSNNKVDIVKRLGELNEWQEDRKKMLDAKQTLQRQMLGMEQRTMYQALGLQCDDNSVRKERLQGAFQSDVAYKDFERLPVSVDSDNDNDKAHSGESLKSYEPSSHKTITSVYSTEEPLNAMQTKQKKPFLKRGQGLKRRFGIDPEKLRISNLPKYKYANAYTKLNVKPQSQPILPPKLKLEQRQCSPTRKKNGLDAQELSFQQLLISSSNVCNSTPDMKSSISNKSNSPASPNYCAALPKVRFVETSLASKNKSEVPPTEGHKLSTQTIAWAKILDPQQIRPTPIIRKTAAPPSPQTETDIFELMEQKAKEGSFDMDSSCIKRFMTQRLSEKFQHSDVVPIYENLKTKRLEPLIGEVSAEEEPYSSMGEEEENVLASQENTEADDDDITQKTADPTDCSYAKENNRVSENHVRFSECNDTHEYQEYDSTPVDSTQSIADNSEADRTNPEFFEQIKKALLTALQFGVEQENDLELHTSVSDSTLTPMDSRTSFACQSSQMDIKEIEQKTQLIKIRLQELENEIAAFKENNMQLMKAKQEFELEKALHAQEQLEAKERLNDEKIKMEIYLHDERMKMEEEKRKHEQQVKSKSQAATANKNKELEKAREQIIELEMQLKIKESNHASAQARWRSKARAMEKDERRLHDQIEILTKENKRMENEILRITRENSNKLLLEINKNIAKLAPKEVEHAAIFSPNNGLPVLPSAKTMSKTIVAKAVANKKSKSPDVQKTKKNQKQVIAKRSSLNRVVPGTPSSGETDSTPETSFCDVKKGTVNIEPTSFDEDDEDILKELQSLAPTKKKHNAIEITKASNDPPKSPLANKAPPSSPTNMKREIINNDGSKDIWYPNGNLKKISADGMLIRMLFYNKDIKETNINEGTVKYYYAESNTWHTTYLDGLEILEFPNGQVEHRYKNGVVEVHYPNNSVKVIDPRDDKKQEEWRFPDGTHLMQMRNGDKILSLPNGQKEIHTKLQKRREYPDGTIKIIYPDGSTETRYSNGRVRVKDKDGKLVMDTEVTA